jgi:hypothetical protein
MEAWDFIIAGGGLFNHLDYSFVAGHEDGAFEYPDTQPGGGSPALRKQLKVLAEFVHGFDFVRMKPDNEVIVEVPAGVTARALGEPGRAYAIYVRPAPEAKGGEAASPIESLALELPAGRYDAQWINVLDGAVEWSEAFEHAGGRKVLSAPAYREDIAIKVTVAK